MVTQATFDANLLLADAVTHTATTSNTALEFPVTAFHSDNDDHDQVIVIVYDIASSDDDGGQIDLTVEVDTTAAFSSAVVVNRWDAVPDGTDPRRFRVAVDLSTVEALEAGATHMRVTTTVTGGTSPTITYTAYVAKLP